MKYLLTLYFGRQEADNYTAFNIKENSEPEAGRQMNVPWDRTEDPQVENTEKLDQRWLETSSVDPNISTVVSTLLGSVSFWDPSETVVLLPSKDVYTHVYNSRAFMDLSEGF